MSPLTTFSAASARLMRDDHRPYRAVAFRYLATSADSGGRRRDFRPHLRALLRHWPRDTRPLHLALVVHDHARVVLEVDEHALAATPRLLLANHDRPQHLLAELRLPLLDSGEDQVARASLGEAVQLGADADNRNDVEILGAAVVGAVHDRRDV